MQYWHQNKATEPSLVQGSRDRLSFVESYGGSLMTSLYEKNVLERIKLEILMAAEQEIFSVVVNMEAGMETWLDLIL